LRRRHAKRIISREEGNAIGAEGQNNRAAAPLAKLARGLLGFATHEVNRLAAVE
jgi:hypothetical protein